MLHAGWRSRCASTGANPKAAAAVASCTAAMLLPQKLLRSRSTWVGKCIGILHLMCFVPAFVPRALCGHFAALVIKPVLVSCVNKSGV